MFRRWSTILGPETLADDEQMTVANRDADVIMTAAVLGFTAGRLAVGDPVEYTVDPKDGQEKLDALSATVARINSALGSSYSFGGKATAAFAPPWQQGAVITGAAGSAKTPFAQRHATGLDAAAQKLRELASADGNAAIGYQGPGAYTGFLDDPVAHQSSIQSTARFNVPADGYGDRWCPPTYTYRSVSGEVVGTQADRAWGLIGGEQTLADMAEEPYTLSPDGNLVGYTHGMVQAIYVATQRGPWCTPFEIAVGKVTTKLASCFTCTLFMYAAGFPPSAIHLGRGSSWVPFYEMRPDTVPANTSNKYSPTTDRAIGALNDCWRLECRQHLALGVKIMKDNGMASVAGDHQDRLGRLDAYLTENGDIYAAPNLILDAVTIHEGESARIDRTLVASK